MTPEQVDRYRRDAEEADRLAHEYEIKYAEYDATDQRWLSLEARREWETNHRAIMASLKPHIDRQSTPEYKAEEWARSAVYLAALKAREEICPSCPEYSPKDAARIRRYLVWLGDRPHNERCLSCSKVSDKAFFYTKVFTKRRAPV